MSSFPGFICCPALHGPEIESAHYTVTKEYHILFVAFDMTFLSIILCVGFVVGVLALLHLYVKKP